MSFLSEEDVILERQAEQYKAGEYTIGEFGEIIFDEIPTAKIEPPRTTVPIAPIGLEAIKIGAEIVAPSPSLPTTPELPPPVSAKTSLDPKALINQIEQIILGQAPYDPKLDFNQDGRITMSEIIILENTVAGTALPSLPEVLPSEKYNVAMDMFGADIEALNASVGQWETEYTSLMDVWSQDVEAFTTTLGQWEEENRTLEAAFEQWNTDYTNYGYSIVALERMIKQYNSFIEQLELAYNAETAALAQRFLEDIEGEQARLEEWATQLTTSLTALQEQETGLSGRITELGDLQTALQQRQAELEERRVLEEHGALEGQKALEQRWTELEQWDASLRSFVAPPSLIPIEVLASGISQETWDSYTVAQKTAAWTLAKLPSPLFPDVQRVEIPPLLVEQGFTQEDWDAFSTEQKVSLLETYSPSLITPHFERPPDVIVEGISQEAWDSLRDEERSEVLKTLALKRFDAELALMPLPPEDTLEWLATPTSDEIATAQYDALQQAIGTLFPGMSIDGLVAYAESDWEGFLEDIRVQGPTHEAYLLLTQMGIKRDDFDALFAPPVEVPLLGAVGMEIGAALAAPPPEAPTVPLGGLAGAEIGAALAEPPISEDLLKFVEMPSGFGGLPKTLTDVPLETLFYDLALTNPEGLMTEIKDRGDTPEVRDALFKVFPEATTEKIEELFAQIRAIDELEVAIKAVFPDLDIVALRDAALNDPEGFRAKLESMPRSPERAKLYIMLYPPTTVTETYAMTQELGVQPASTGSPAYPYWKQGVPLQITPEMLESGILSDDDYRKIFGKPEWYEYSALHPEDIRVKYPSKFTWAEALETIRWDYEGSAGYLPIVKEQWEELIGFTYHTGWKYPSWMPLIGGTEIQFGTAGAYEQLVTLPLFLMTGSASSGITALKLAKASGSIPGLVADAGIVALLPFAYLVEKPTALIVKWGLGYPVKTFVSMGAKAGLEVKAAFELAFDKTLGKWITTKGLTEEEANAAINFFIKDNVQTLYEAAAANFEKFSVAGRSTDDAINLATRQTIEDMTPALEKAIVDATIAKAGLKQGYDTIESLIKFTDQAAKGEVRVESEALSKYVAEETAALKAAREIPTRVEGMPEVKAGYEFKNDRYWKEVDPSIPQEPGQNFRLDLETNKSFVEVPQAEALAVPKVEAGVPKAEGVIEQAERIALQEGKALDWQDAIIARSSSGDVGDEFLAHLQKKVRGEFISEAEQFEWMRLAYQLERKLPKTLPRGEPWSYSISDEEALRLVETGQYRRASAAEVDNAYKKYLTPEEYARVNEIKAIEGRLPTPEELDEAFAPDIKVQAKTGWLESAPEFEWYIPIEGGAKAVPKVEAGVAKPITEVQLPSGTMAEIVETQPGRIWEIRVRGEKAGTLIEDYGRGTVFGGGEAVAVESRAVGFAKLLERAREQELGILRREAPANLTPRDKAILGGEVEAVPKRIFPAPSDAPGLEGKALWDSEYKVFVKPNELYDSAIERKTLFFQEGEGHDMLAEARAILRGDLESIASEAPRITYNPTKRLFEVRYDSDRFLRKEGLLSEETYRQDIAEVVGALKREFPGTGISIPETGEFHPGFIPKMEGMPEAGLQPEVPAVLRKDASLIETLVKKGYTLDQIEEMTGPEAWAKLIEKIIPEKPPPSKVELITGGGAEIGPTGKIQAIERARTMVEQNAPRLPGKIADIIPGVKQIKGFISPSDTLPKEFTTAWVARQGVRSELATSYAPARESLLKEMDTLFGTGTRQGGKTQVRYIGEVGVVRERELQTFAHIAQNPELYVLNDTQEAFIRKLHEHNLTTLKTVRANFGVEIGEFPVKPGGAFIPNVDIAEDAIKMVGTPERAAVSGRAKTRVWETMDARIAHDPSFTPDLNMERLLWGMDEAKAEMAARQTFIDALGGKTRLEVMRETHPALAAKMESLRGQLQSLRASSTRLEAKQLKAIDDFLASPVDDIDLLSLREELEPVITKGIRAGADIKSLQNEIKGIRAQISDIRPAWLAANLKPYTFVQEGIYRYFTKEQADQLRTLLQVSDNRVLTVMEAVRNVSFNFDLSPLIGVQVPQGMFAAPGAAIKQFANWLVKSRTNPFSPKALAKEIGANEASMQSWREFSFAMGRAVTAGTPEEFSGGLLRKLPGYKKINEGLFTLSTRISKRLYDDSIATLKQMGMPHDVAVAAAADTVGKVVPLWNPSLMGLSSARQKLFRSVVISPSYILRPAQLLTEAMEGFIKIGLRQRLTPKQALSARYVATTIGTIEALAVMSAMIEAQRTGRDVWQAAWDALTPGHRTFFALTLPGGDKIGLGGPLRSLVNAFIPRQVGDSDIAIPFAGLPNWAVGKFTPVLRTQYDLLRNKDFYGNRIVGGEFPSNIIEWLTYQLETPLPLSLKAVTEGIRTGLPPGRLGREALSQILGLSYSEASSYVVRDQAVETWARAQGLEDIQKFSDLSPSQQAAFWEEHPEIDAAIRAETERRAELGQEWAIPSQQAEELRQQMLVRQANDDASIEQWWGGNETALDPNTWRENRKIRMLELNAQRDLIYAYVQDKPAKTAVDRYYQEFDRIKEAHNGIMTDAAWDELDIWVSEQSKADRQYIEENTRLSSYTPLVNQYFKDLDEMAAYWEVDSKERAAWRAEHGDIEVLLLKWGYLTTAKSVEGQAWLDQRTGLPPQPTPKPGSVESLDLTTKAITVLTDAGLNTLEDFAGMTRQEILDLPDVGEGTVSKIEAALAEQGLSFKVLPTPTSKPTPMPEEPWLNINTGSLSDWESLPGIGPALAQRILDYIAANGEFASIDDLKDVSGIGQSNLEKIRKYLTLGGEPTPTGGGGAAPSQIMRQRPAWLEAIMEFAAEQSAESQKTTDYFGNAVGQQYKESWGQYVKRRQEEVRQVYGFEVLEGIGGGVNTATPSQEDMDELERVIGVMDEKIRQATEADGFTWQEYTEDRLGGAQERLGADWLKQMGWIIYSEEKTPEGDIEGNMWAQGSFEEQAANLTFHEIQAIEDAFRRAEEQAQGREEPPLREEPKEEVISRVLDIDTLNKWFEEWDVPESERAKLEEHAGGIIRNYPYLGGYIPWEIWIGEIARGDPSIYAHEFAHANEFEQMPKAMKPIYAFLHKLAQVVSPEYKKMLIESYPDEKALLPVEGYATAYQERKLPWFLEPFYGNLLYPVDDLPTDSNKAALAWLTAWVEFKIREFIQKLSQLDVLPQKEVAALKRGMLQMG